MIILFPNLFTPLASVLAAAPTGGIVVWPFGLAVFVWLVTAALVGTLLGILRERTMSSVQPRVRSRRPQLAARLHPLHHPA